MVILWAEHIERAEEMVIFWDGELRKATTQERIDLCERILTEANERLKEANGIYVASHHQQKQASASAVVTPAQSRISKIVESLNKRSIDIPDKRTLQRSARDDKLLDFGCINTDCAHDSYRSVRESASTETKSFIGKSLNLFINCAIFDSSSRIFSAQDEISFKMIKILRVGGGTASNEYQQRDVGFEIYASTNFAHEAIVLSTHASIKVDSETAKVTGCRVGMSDVLIMPWFFTALHKCPSANLKWISIQATRMVSALEFIHDKGFVHMDVKATNILVDSNMNWFLGDFGSCKPIGEGIKSSTFRFYHEDMAFKPAHPKYDWFMFLVLILIESLEDRRTYSRLFLSSGTSSYVNLHKVIAYAKCLLENTIIGSLISLLLEKYDTVL